MPAIASLEDLKSAQKEGLGHLRYALPVLRSPGRTWEDALCCMNMAQDRLEERLQALAGGKDSRRFER